MLTYYSRQKFSTIFLSVLFIISILTLGACGNTEEKKSSNEPKKVEAKPYTVEHAMGTTEIKDTPKRVVILTNEGTEALLAMDVKPVGAVQSWTGDPWYAHINDKMDGVTSVGNEGEPSVETIASLKPDLIIGNKMRHEKIYDQLSAIAPTVFAETLRGDWKENFKLYSKAVNKEDVGNKVIADFDKRVENMKTELGDKLKQKVSIVRFMPGDVRIYHKDSFSGVIFDQLGFARAEGQDAPDFAEKGVTKERIPAMDGDVLFYFTYDPAEKKGEGPKLAEEWINDPLFKNLNVAKNNKIQQVDDAIWNTAGGVIASNLLLDDIENYFSK
ncbi:MAG: iron siderophore-binding protein [Bacillales bacterium]|jgi:iron complex transport system substrate-binding protein|nr:iron siderophore-binding protein [Bacillales bacterium]